MSSDAPVLDPATLNRLRALAAAAARPGEDILGDLVRLFGRDSRQRLDALREAWQAGRAKEAARLAHTIKGAAAQLGAVRVVAEAVAVEAATAEPYSEGRLDRLAAEIAAAQAELERLLRTP